MKKIEKLKKYTIAPLLCWDIYSEHLLRSIKEKAATRKVSNPKQPQ